MQTIHSFSQRRKAEISQLPSSVRTGLPSLWIALDVNGQHSEEPAKFDVR